MTAAAPPSLFHGVGVGVETNNGAMVGLTLLPVGLAQPLPFLRLYLFTEEPALGLGPEPEATTRPHHARTQAPFETERPSLSRINTGSQLASKASKDKGLKPPPATPQKHSLCRRLSGQCLCGIQSAPAGPSGNRRNDGDGGLALPGNLSSKNLLTQGLPKARGRAYGR